MRMSTMKGLAAGSMIGMTVGAGMMMTPRGKKMKRILMKSGANMVKQVMEFWS